MGGKDPITWAITAGASVVVQQVKLPPAAAASHMGTGMSSSCSASDPEHIHANVLRKAVEDDTCARVPGTHSETQMDSRFQASA